MSEIRNALAGSGGAELGPIHGGGVSSRLGLGVLLLVWVAILLAFRHQVALVLQAWDSLPSHAHGYVVLVVVAYFLWSKRAALLGISPRPSPVGFACFVGVGFVALLGEVVSLAAVVQFALVFMLITSVWAVLGYGAARRSLGPLSFLLFAVPFGQEVLPVLMNWTADMTVLAVRASGVPVFQEGRNFVVPSGRWSVVEACGGVRYLLTSVFVGAVFAYITYTRWYKRALFMVWAVIMSLTANWVRAYTIVMVAHFSDNEWGMGMSHLTLGWVIFALAIFGSFSAGSRWRDPVSERTLPPESAEPRGVPVIIAGGLLAMTIPFAYMGLARHLENGPTDSDPVLDLRSLAALPEVENALDGLRPKFWGARAVHQRTYDYKGMPVDVYVAYYRNQRQGEELVNVSNRLDPVRDWNWSSSALPDNTHPGVPDVRLEGYLKEGRHAAVYFLYWVNGMTTTSEPVSKLLEAVSRLRGRGDDGAAVAITAYSTENLEAARQQTDAFAAEFLPGILKDLESTASGRHAREAGR